MYHFCIGHKFKTIDTSIFEYQFDEVRETRFPTKFLKLQKENFTFIEDLYKLINNIRDLNSHYVYTFDQIEISQINSNIINFLKEGFHLSVLINYLKEKEKSYEDFKTYNNNPLVGYLRDKFFPNKKYQKNERNYFSKLNLSEAINELLFIDVENDFDWLINKEHNVFTIKKGRYLSYNAQLFLLSMFLYKQEAEQLISKIKGFKESDDKSHYKRDIFTFFSKKISSQDIDSEEKYLIRFRDIIQYLNKYPVQWNKELELESSFPLMTDSLEKHVIETEIFRSFPSYSESPEKDKFLKYTVEKLFGSKLYLFDFSNITIANEDIKKFDFEIDSSPELKDTIEKLQQFGDGYLPKKQHQEKRRLINKKVELEKEQNPIKEKLIKKIEENSLIKSYGRNQDRFMDYAIRYLAETKYFGTDTSFKTYQFYTTDEQNEFIENAKNELQKKEYDNFKYHQGRLVHFIDYQNHLVNYPEWDTPFVIENNAFQIKLKLSDGEYRLFSIQRSLLLYFLEDALYAKDSVKNKGLDLLTDYFENHLLKDFVQVQANRTPTTSLHRKLLPKRFINQQNLSAQPNFGKIIEEAEKQEKIYNLLLQNAIESNTQEEFQKRNKGKQFKLRFIRKAWHLMYFKAIYNEKAEKIGHHKSLHITKDEFNDFSKWMFAFDEVPQYKEYLSKLFNRKGFFKNESFQSLFEKSKSLDDFYNLTIDNFRIWIENNKILPKTRDNDYKTIFEKKIIYINLSHFLYYLDKAKFQNNGIVFEGSKNAKYLIPNWYYRNILPKEEYKENSKLFNQLRKIKLEDALLYEIALRYLYLDETITKSAKNHVKNILKSEISFNITDAKDKSLYKLIVPFNKLETLAILIQHKTEQIEKKQNNKTSFLTNLDKFLQQYKGKYPGEIKKAVEEYKCDKSLSFDNLNLINSHLISSSIKFTKIHMQLEEYYVLKFSTKIIKENRIETEEIKDNKGHQIFNQYYSSRVRNKAFHFGVPDNPYIVILIEVEKKISKNELLILRKNTYADLPTNIQHVCDSFMNILHNDLYRKEKKDSEKAKEKFKEKYFTEIIKNKLFDILNVNID